MSDLIMRKAFEKITNASVAGRGARLTAEECRLIAIDPAIAEATACYSNADMDDFDEDGNLPSD